MHVAFFRNLNQGQRGHPRTADLIEAFSVAGVVDAAPVGSNGTLVFASDDPAAVAEDVSSVLRARGLYDDAVFVRPLAFVEELVARFAGGSTASRTELTLFAPDAVLPSGGESAFRKRLCEVVDDGPGWAVVRNDRERQSNGTSAAESVLGAPATSRAFSTLTRLAERFGP